MKQFCALLIGLNLYCLNSSQAQTILLDTAAFSRFYQTLPTVFHRNFYEYTSTKIPYKFIFSTDSASLERNFDEAGRITYEYLDLENDEWMLRYFDKNGQCYKYRKASECFYLYNDREPYQTLFDSAIKTTERILVEKFGEDFYKKHIRLSDISWRTKYGYGGSNMHPFNKPSQFSVYAYLYLNDSTETDLGKIYLDSLLRPTNEDYGSFFEIINSPKSDCLKKTNFNSLVKLFEKGGYHFSSIDWDNEKTSFLASYWSDPFFRLIEKDTLWERKSLTYDLCTKKYRTETHSIYEAEIIACGYFSPFKKEFKDTFQLEPGWRKIYLDEAIINIPEGWNLYTEKYSYDYKTTFITNGKDTLIYQLFYGLMAEWDDSITNDPLYQELEKRFPEGTRFGREVDFYLRQVGTNCYSLSLITIEEGVGMNFNEISNSFKFERLCPGHISLALDILDSIRFFHY